MLVVIYSSGWETVSIFPGVAKFGIALEWGSRGLEFESRHSDQIRIIRTQSSKLEMCSDFPFLSNIYSDKIWAGSIPALVALMNSVGESIRSSATIILYLSFIFVKDCGNIFLRHKLNNFADRCAFLFR